MWIQYTNVSDIASRGKTVKGFQNLENGPVTSVTQATLLSGQVNYRFVGNVRHDQFVLATKFAVYISTTSKTTQGVQFLVVFRRTVMAAVLFYHRAIFYRFRCF